MLRRIRTLWTLARRGAWHGFGRFAGAWLWGLTHTYCRKCGIARKVGFSPLCNQCQLINLLLALRETNDEEDADAADSGEGSKTS